MLKSDLTPPTHGAVSDPVLYGVAAALAEIFPPLPSPVEAEPASQPDEGDGES